ncbi:F-box/kelch-repeat protein [Dorcoceras hygrometricum]|uniref:F-box/kelch-repeat protein n=1 Tax=Dorcoceras hygrometricum TaxID=472368 RepID=A0A2Z7DCG4_9LAMI|nr:F-box/kelch-repeat protein [Dorcoceras hygrometricum]
MPPKRRDQTDKNKKIENMPELEELPTTNEELQDISVQNMVDCIEGHSHGHATAKQPVEPQEEIPEKNTVEMEEASKMVSEANSKERGHLKKYKPKEGAWGAKMADHNIPRFVLPSNNEVDTVWKLARHNKFPKALTKTQKMRMLRERAAAKREITGEVVSRSMFCRKSTEYKSSIDSSSEDDT